MTGAWLPWLAAPKSIPRLIFAGHLLLLVISQSARAQGTPQNSGDSLELLVELLEEVKQAKEAFRQRTAVAPRG